MKTILIILLSFVALQLKAQDQDTLLLFANSTEVRRISNNPSTIKRPLLSLNTMYSGKNYQKGYDLEFVLNNTQLHATTLKAIFDDAEEPIVGSPIKTSDVDQNSRVLQHWAFKTLATYVRTQVRTAKNLPIGSIPANPAISLAFDADNHDLFLTALKLSASHYLVSENNSSGITNDYVKWAQSLANYARAIDLYLAFEIAVMHYQPQLESQLLLSMAEKRQLLINISRGILNGHEALNVDVSGIFGVQEDEIEAGNRPMKMHAALGYACLVIQDVHTALTNGDDYLAYSIHSAFNYAPLLLAVINTIQSESQSYLNPNADKNSRKNYWAYQSNGGERMWAEGPYYLEYALREVVPYWHAKRIAGHVPTSGTNDPFNNSKFTNPLQWLIDIHTPDGNMPPIDDGNKRTIKYGKILGFASPYVNSASSIKLGENWRWLHKVVQKENSSDNNLFLLELAIPQVSNDGVPFNNMIYNNDDQQIVSRYKDTNGTVHYIYLNGEKGRSIIGGEGHEHPDQLQLLYYVKEANQTEQSILMGTGYDRGDKFYNSMWNDYALKNSLNISDYTKTGGIQAPAEGASNIVLNKHKTSVHQDVLDLNVVMNSNELLVLKGKSYLINYVSDYDYKFPYEREVLFVKGESPYLIDLNSFHIDKNNVTQQSYLSLSAGVSYFTDSDEVLFSKNDINTYEILYKNYNNKAYLYFVPIEYSNMTTNAFSFIGDMYSREVQKRDGEGFTDDTYRNFLQYLNGSLGKTYNSIIKNSEDNLWFNLFMNGAPYGIYNSKSIDSLQIGYLTKQIKHYAYNPGAGSWNAISLLSMNDFNSKITLLNPLDLNAYNNPHQLIRIDINSTTKDFIYKRKGVPNRLNVAYLGNYSYLDNLNTEINFSVIDKAYAFARYKLENGQWILDADNSINIIDNASYQITQNTSIGNNQSPSSFKKQHVQNNITITIAGDALLSDKVFKMSNNSKIRFVSGNPEINNLVIESVNPTDSYTIEIGTSYTLSIQNGKKVTFSGNPTILGSRLQIDSDGELVIKDGSNVSFSNSLQFYNYGTFRVGTGAQINLTNQTHFSSSNFIVNEHGAMPSTLFNVAPNGVLNLQGMATVKNTSFKKNSSSNFSHVNITGNTTKSFENVTIEGSNYGFHVSNVSPNKLIFKNVVGRNNFYSAIKANNSYLTIDGFDGRFAIQDGISAYSYSNVTLAGWIKAQYNLLGIRSAYNSIINLTGNGYLDITNNTQGVLAYQSGKVYVQTSTGLTHVVHSNTSPSATYPSVLNYDLNAQSNGYVFINPADPLMHAATVNQETGGIVSFEIGQEGRGVEYATNHELKESLSSSGNAKNRSEFIAHYRELRKDESKQTERKQWIKSHKEHATKSIRSAAQLLDVLDGALDENYEWVSRYDKKARLSPLVDEDALLIAEQLFLYYVQTEPNREQAIYWLAELGNMNHESIATGFFDVLLSQANFENVDGMLEEETSDLDQEQDQLVQAYPNPFNPTTSLRFKLKEKAQVAIQVYDIVGRVVQTLTNTQWQSGTHELRFDASALASGIYFARTTISQSGNRVKNEVTKLLLIK